MHKDSLACALRQAVPGPTCLPAVILLLGALFCLPFLAGCSEEAQKIEEQAVVHYLRVSERPLTLTTSLPGRVTPLVVSEVRPQVDGIILERLFEEGSMVEKGQILYRIDPAVYRAACNVARATLAEAQASLVALAHQERRYRSLSRSGSVGRQDLDNAIASHGEARAKVERARAELDAAAINLAYTEIRAPVSGRIGASRVTPGALVTASQAAPLARIQKLDEVHVDMTRSVADTLELRRSLARGRLAQDKDAGLVWLTLEDGSVYTSLAAATDPAPNQKAGTAQAEQALQGRLLFSENMVNETTGTITLRALFQNPDSVLLPGMYVTAHLDLGTLEKAITIPQRCVQADDKGHFVRLLTPEDSAASTFRVVRRGVKLGRSIDRNYLVTSGLEPGDLLVVDGLQKATFGAVVRGSSVDLPDSSAADARPKSRGANVAETPGTSAALQQPQKRT